MLDNYDQRSMDASMYGLLYIFFTFRSKNCIAQDKSYMVEHQRHHAEVAEKATWPGKMYSYVNLIRSIQVRETKRSGIGQ